MDERAFDGLVSGFYAAATGDITWPQALSPLAAAFRARAAVIQTVDRSDGRIMQLSIGGPLEPQASFDYMREWHQLDPRKRHLVAHCEELLDAWWFCDEHFDAQFTRSDAFYTHYLSGYRTRYLATQLLSPSPNLLSAFALELPAERGPLNPDERHLADRLGHHAREALRQYERVRRMAAAALAGHALLDAFPYAVWLLDEDRFVYYSNAPADDPAAIGERTRVLDGRLQLTLTAADRQLGIRLAQLVTGPHGSRTLVDARRRSTDPVCWLHLVKIEPIQALGAFGDRPLVMATLYASDRLTKLDQFALAEVFSLTPAQARVAVLLADGITADDIAAQLGCGVPTVRTHIANVTAKIGAKRLSDAIRLLRQGEALWASAPVR